MEHMLTNQSQLRQKSVASEIMNKYYQEGELLTYKLSMFF
jgi:hypothetical protein